MDFALLAGAPDTELAASLSWGMTRWQTWMLKKRIILWCTLRSWMLSRSQTWSSMRLCAGDIASQG